MAKKYIPVRTDYVFRTRALQNKQTGLLEGREGPRSKKPYKSTYGDYTAVRRASKDTDIDGDKKPDVFKGEILGREKKEKGIIYVKGSKRQRAYTKN